jgi:hypothetical protein
MEQGKRVKGEKRVITPSSSSSPSFHTLNTQSNLHFFSFLHSLNYTLKIKAPNSKGSNKLTSTKRNKKKERNDTSLFFVLLLCKSAQLNSIWMLPPSWFVFLLLLWIRFRICLQSQSLALIWMLKRKERIRFWIVWLAESVNRLSQFHPFRSSSWFW